MKAYRFRLEPVLGVRKKKEEAMQQELARVQSAYMEEREAAEGLSAAREESCGRLRAVQDPGDDMELDIVDATLYHSYLLRLAREIASQEQLLERLENEVEKAREGVIRARQGRRTLERLKEKQFARFLIESAHAEQKAFDEIGQMRYSRAGHKEGR
ncbi:MAG TPA: flagellar export protein FliJ [Firmicutes bacterium]|nr:flagellar export protein FliJ [Bacillota bacterium]